MYTGTLIKELMATVQRAEQSAERKRLAEASELYRIYALQVPVMEADQILMGAA